MATTQPTSNPVEPEEPEVTPSSRQEATTPSPSPSPSPSTTASPPPPTTSSPAPTTASPSPSPSETESEEPSTTSTSSSTTTSTSSSTSSSTSTEPSTTSTSTTSSSSSSSSSRPAETTITSTVSQSRPGLVTSFSSVSRSSTVSGAAASSTSKGGIGGSGLPVGGLVGIIIGGLVVLCVLAMIVTRTFRKRARAKRTAHRSSMFEPWPAPVTMEDDDDIEKSRYSPPSQVYPMQNTGSYDYETYDVYGQAGVGAGAAAAGAAGGAAAATYPPSNGHGNDYQYPQQDYGYQGSQGHEYAQSQPGAPPSVNGGTAAAIGLRDGMMAKVQVGFNRTLEDELAINPGQQLWLHQVYDDGWAMCEDQNQNRGVVPITSLVPWSDEDPNHLSGMSRSNTGGSLSNSSRRHSSLYANAQAGQAYLAPPQ